MKLLESLFFLAYHLLALTFEKTKQLFLPQKKGKAYFYQNYVQPNNTCLSMSQIESQREFSKCFLCGLCDAQSQDFFETGIIENISLLPSAYTRNPQDYDLLEPLTALPETKLHELSKICPANIDFILIKKLVKSDPNQQN